MTVPELPVVETLRRGLAARIIGMRVTAVEIGDRKIFDGPEDAIRHDIEGHQISRVERRGKVLMLFLREPGRTPDPTGSLLIHPKMTGQLVLTSGGVTVFAGGHPTPSMLRPMPNATTRAIFRLGPACRLYYSDARRFGWIRPAGPDPCRTDPFLARLGPDPLGADFTPAALQQALGRHPRAPVKAVLLDQAAIAGIGNIYADEVLHRARIRPSRPAGGLSQAEARRLHAAIREILRAAVDSGGTNFAGYVNEARGQLLPAMPAALRRARSLKAAGKLQAAAVTVIAQCLQRQKEKAVYSKIKIAGHPVHTMLVAFPVACYAGTLVGFAVYAANGHLFWLNLAIALSVTGTGTAVLAALAGLADWALGIPRDSAAKMTGLLHAGLNVTALGLFLAAMASYVTDWNGPAVQHHPMSLLHHHAA